MFIEVTICKKTIVQGQLVENRVDPTHHLGLRLGLQVLQYFVLEDHYEFHEVERGDELFVYHIHGLLDKLVELGEPVFGHGVCEVASDKRPVQWVDL